MVPLRYTEGGVLNRRGHTEAATGERYHIASGIKPTNRTYMFYVDLCKLTNLPAVGLLCELVKPDDPMGSMARRDDCKAFAQQWGFKMISIDQLQEYMSKRIVSV
jgi:3,4-dihydroxy-2-butanone 4-phosphate synthase